MADIHLDVVLPAHNARACLPATLDALLTQEFPPRVSQSIIVVDDASTDGTAELVAATYGGRVRLARTGRNLGRGGACNTGAAAGNGTHVAILDSDCIPAHPRLMAAHLAALASGAEVSLGNVSFEDDSPFWRRYQANAQRQRLSAARGGDFSAMTTANSLFTRAAYERVAGFDPAFRRYGFEDRDLIARLQSSGTRLTVTEDAVVRHRDPVRLTQVLRKLEDSGRSSGLLFARRHPEIYRLMAYARVDANLNPALRLPGLWLGPLLPRFAPIVEPLTRRADPGYALRRMLVMGLSALAYLHGTLRAGPPRD